uniref:Brevinin 1Tc n=1 Tax=Rana temporaria TaxID=8407 RepID=B1ITC_RANTE|nr:RecName: Full=Brevinin 1Tc [Rana temporaria]
LVPMFLSKLICFITKKC